METKKINIHNVALSIKAVIDKRYGRILNEAFNKEKYHVKGK